MIFDLRPTTYEMIAIIDYDMGNLKSVAKAFEKVGAKVCVTRDPQKIKSASKIVLPGVGAFPQCMENLSQYGLVEILKEEIKNGKLFLGICLGLQLLFEESEEHGGAKGLGIVKGKVVRFSSRVARGVRCVKNEQRLKIPHMGWNQINIERPHSKKGAGIAPLLNNIDDQSNFYFVHSYYVVPVDLSIISTTTEYGISFCSSIYKENIFACQFHPEKSQKIGLKVLENFVRLK